MNRAFLLFIFIQWYPFLLVKSSSSSFFNFDKDRFEVPYYVNENFSIGATFNLPSSYKCSNSQCLTNLKLTLKNDDQIFMDLWCDSPAVFLIKKYGKMDELSCVLNGIDATLGSYQLSALVQVHMAGSFLPIFSAVFPNNPGANQEWSNKEIIVLNSPMDTQQSMNLRTIKRNKRQDVNVDGAHFQPTIVQADSVDNGTVDPMQTMPVNDETNAMNQPMQLNTYTGTANSGHTADLTCDGANSCPDYPKTDEQGRAICCFLLPQPSDGITALSSVIYQNRTQNLNDFQVNIGDGQSFNAANDSSVFLGPVIAASQCKIILPPGTIESNSTQFRITWTYHPNSANNNSSSPAATTWTDGTLPVNVLRVTSISAFVQQKAQYNEWFVCPSSQDGPVSLLRSIALLAGDNIGYFRCIYVNKQGIPLKDPTNGQLLVFFSSKNGASDNPTITVLSAVHTDCISIQFFPNNGTSIDLNSILLSITIAFQTAATTNMSSVLPQVSDLKGTSQIEIDITTDLSPNNDSNIDNNGQTSAQTLLPSEIDNSANVLSDQCARYQPDIPMSYDISLGTYTGTFDIPSQNSQPTILDSVTVTASSTVENPITMLLVDSQGNTLSPSYSLTSAATFQGGTKTSISKVILQATAMQDAAMDSTLHADIVVCPGNTKANGSAQSPHKSSIPSPQTYNPDTREAEPESLPMSEIAPISQKMTPIQSIPSPSSGPSDVPLSCQERASSTYGTYPPDLLALTIPTKRPPKMPRPQSTIKPEVYATPSTPYQSLSVKTLPDHTCFDQIPFTNNPFLYDILISASDYTNSIDCLSPTSGCSLNFINAKQPKITLLFTTPACISYLRIPSPSNVQQFSYSMYDEDGTQMQLSGATDNQGTLVSSLGADPIVQLSQSSCGYSIILQFLNTSDNGPAMRVTIDTGGCFKNLSTMTTTTPSVPSPMPPAEGPPSWSQEMPSFVPARSKIQPFEFAPAPVFAPSPIVPLFPPLPSSPVAQLPPPFIQGAPSSLSTLPWIAPPVPLYCANNYQLTTLSFENQCLSEILTSDPTVVPDYSLNEGNQGVNFQSNIPITITYQFSCIVYIKYICITGMFTNVNKFSYVILDSNQNNIGQGIVTRLTSDQCTPRPLPTAELASQVIITIEETTDGQPPRNIVIDMQACFLLSSVPLQPEYFQPEPFPLASPPASIPLSPLPFETMRISPIQSFSPPSPFASSPVLNPSPQLVSEKMLPSPISDPSPPPELAPSVTGISSPILQTSPPPPSYQAMLPSPIWSTPSVLSPSTPLQPPSPFPSQTIRGSSILSSPSSSSVSPEVPFPSPPDPIQPPIMPAQQYSPPVVNPSSIYQVPPMAAPPQPLPSPIASNTITTQPLAPLVDANNGELMPLTFNSPCISQISTSDPSVLVDSNINPGAQGVNFQSNVPITITIQFSCNIQIAYICIPGSTTNVELFSYTLQDIYNNPVSSGFINPSETDGCVPRSLDIANPATQLIITILQTKDGQPPRNVILDLQGYYVSTVPSIPTQPPFIAVTPSAQDVAPVRPPFQIQPLMPLETAPMLVPVQLVFPAQQIHSAPSSQNPITPTSIVSMDTCPEVSLTNHPGVELIVFSDGTTVTNDLNPDGDGCNLVSTGAIMTVILRNNMSATFSSIGVFSSNVNQIDVALFDEISNRPLIQSPQGTLRSSVTLNPSIQNLPDSPAGTLAVTFLSTVDRQPPRDVKLLVYACFPTITEILPSSPSTSPSMQPAQDPSQVSRTNMFNQQPDYPVNPSNQTYPNNQQYQYSSTGPTSVCIDPNQPAQVTSVANTPLPSSYYSSNQCVCICQSGVIIPTSSGVIQYYPPSRTINKRTIREKPSEQRSRKRHHISTKSKN